MDPGLREDYPLHFMLSFTCSVSPYLFLSLLLPSLSQIMVEEIKYSNNAYGIT
jgi:hypothetical protein